MASSKAAYAARALEMKRLYRKNGKVPQVQNVRLGDSTRGKKRKRCTQCQTWFYTHSESSTICVRCTDPDSHAAKSKAAESERRQRERERARERTAAEKKVDEKHGAPQKSAKRLCPVCKKVKTVNRFRCAACWGDRASA